jgi:ribosomal protein uL24
MSRLSPHSPRRQRKALYTASTYRRRRRMSVPLSRELRARFHRRSIPLRKGDTVRVLAGSYVGREERVAKVVRRDYAVVLDNVTLKTGEDKLKPLPIRTGNLVITRLNLSDAWRRRALRVADEDVTPEELGSAEEEGEAEATPALPAPAETAVDADAKDATAADETPAPPAKKPKRPRSPAPSEDEDDDGGDEEEDEP